MSTELLTVSLLVISILSGFLGGLLGACVYQKNQRSRDKRRWDDVLKQSESTAASVPESDTSGVRIMGRVTRHKVE